VPRTVLCVLPSTFIPLKFYWCWTELLADSASQITFLWNFSPISEGALLLVRPSPSWGTAVVQCLRRCATNRKVAGLIPAGVSVVFIDIKSFGSNYRPGVHSASNRNEYQEYFLGVKKVGA